MFQVVAHVWPIIGITEGRVSSVHAKIAKGVVCESEKIFMQVSHAGHE